MSPSRWSPPPRFAVPLLLAALAGGPSPAPAGTGASTAAGSIPRPVTVARTTEIPRCGLHVDAGASAGDGSQAKPFKTIAAAVEAASPGAVICVAEGTYKEELRPGEKYFTLAGGFQRGFRQRDSAKFVSKAQGSGGSFLLIDNEGPKKDQLTAIDGFEITGYGRAVVREVYYSQRFDLTNNHIHDNRCPEAAERPAGAGFALNNVSGRIEGNVFRNNVCARGGAGALNDALSENTVVVARNWVDRNAGTEPGESHGGALYLFGKTLEISGNLFTGNTVTGWGAGLYVGAYPPGGMFTRATLSWNVYRDNRAGIAGGGLFCDDGANCTSLHDVFDRNCGGNIYLDGGNGDKDPTISRFEHVTVFGALDTDCKEPGPGLRVDGSNLGAPDSHTVVNGLFWQNGPDIAPGCDKCPKVRVTISQSMLDTKYVANNLKVTFGPGIVAPADPLFADPGAGDFHLQSAAGRWTPAGVVQDPVSSPALGKGTARGTRTELGAYGDSPEASRGP